MLLEDKGPGALVRQPTEVSPQATEQVGKGAEWLWVRGGDGADGEEHTHFRSQQELNGL